ncbi:unnamed protein product [Triticum turgidum subsp. durum]|uniref:Uncharacterized protein n=2 Tax=Triticum TaxID=4564 RepID=A0A9R1AWE1_TRITD|nr:unnamed protein product [Triticum turgidum subsp. durum]
MAMGMPSCDWRLRCCPTHRRLGGRGFPPYDGGSARRPPRLPAAPHATTTWWPRGFPARQFLDGSDDALTRRRRQLAEFCTPKL